MNSVCCAVDACNLMSAILLEANSPGGFDTAQPMLRLCFLALQQAINQHSQRAYVHDAEEDHLKQLWECVIVPCLRPVTDAVGGDRNSLAALAVATFVHVLRWADSSLEMLPSYIWESVGATVEHELGAGHQAVHWQQMCIALLALARGSDPAAVSFSLRICDAALSLVTSHERTRRLMASLQLMPALRSCAVAGVAAAAADGLHTAVLSLAAIPGETRQDAYSILCQFVSSTPAWYASPAFW